ncbi:hypothetical protein BO78DRAFT_312825, partial [Aspergillus sclerotiicarbonarius CBS 121057]
QPLPDLRYGNKKFRTISKTTQKLWFLSNLSQWNIEMQARKYSESINWTDDIQGYEFDKERLECGDEHSVVARFNQNLCHASTPSLHGYVQEGLRFGDFKCASSDAGFNKVPDIVLITKEHNMRLVGEAKTPWMHNIEEQQEKIASFRNFIAGQIANYMHKTKCKYGWLTTYNQTMFFRQVPHPKKKGTWVLCHSPVINHDAKYDEVDQEKSNDPTQYRRRVTLTECFLYIAKKACEDGEAINPMHGLRWVGTDSSKVNQLDDGYISIDEEEDTSPSPIMTRSSTRRLGANPSINSLQADTERLDLKGQSHPYSTLEWKRGSITIYFQDSEHKWYYTAKGKQVYIELHQDPDEGDFFVSGKYRYRVKKSQ